VPPAGSALQLSYTQTGTCGEEDLPATLPTTGLVLRLSASRGVVVDDNGKVCFLLSAEGHQALALWQLAASRRVYKVESLCPTTSSLLQVEEWKDLSGTGNSLAAMSVARAPVLLSNGNGLGSTPSVSFDGNENALTKDIDVNLPTGNTVERSVFMLVRYDSTGWGGFSWGTIGCLTVFGLGVTPGKGNIFVESYCTDDTEQAGVTGNLPASCPQEVPLLMRRGADMF